MEGCKTSRRLGDISLTLTHRQEYSVSATGCHGNRNKQAVNFVVGARKQTDSCDTKALCMGVKLGLGPHSKRNKSIKGVCAQRDLDLAGQRTNGRTSRPSLPALFGQLNTDR